MKANRPGGSFAKRHFDKLALVGALAVLLASAVILVLQVASQKAALDSGASVASSDGIAAAALDISNQMQRVEQLRNPFSVPQSNQRMVVGELRVSCVKCAKPISFEAMTCPFCSEPQPEGPSIDRDSDGDGIPDAIERDMGLNPADPSDAFADPDGDRFNNLLEHRHGSIHTNAASTPPLHTMLRLLRLQVEVFSMRFVSIVKGATGVDVFQLNMRDLRRTHLKKLGESAEGWTLDSYNAADPEGPTLLLKKGDTVKRLVQGKIVPEESRIALVVNLLDPGKQPLQLKKDEVFSLGGKSYKVVDISETRVVIRDQSTESEITIGLITAEDRRFIQGGGGPSVPLPGAPPVRP